MVSESSSAPGRSRVWHTRSQSRSEAVDESASPGSPSVVPAELVLQTGPDKPSGPVDRALHTSVLRELIGLEVREIIRAELKSAIAASPGGRAHVSGAPSHPKECVSAGALAGAEGVSPDAEAEASMTKPLIARKASRAGLDVPIMERPSTNANARHQMTSDIARTGIYMHDLSMAKRLDVIETEALDRIEAHELAQQFPSLKECILRVDQVLSLIGDDNVSPPPSSSILSQIADSCWFQTAGNVVTVLNCAFLTYLANWNFAHYSESVPEVISYIDRAFLVLFSLELAARLGRYRWMYFYDANYRMNWMDFIIVVAGMIDLAADLLGSPSFLNHLRALRLLKVLRIVRILRMFRTLRVVLESLSNTLTDLFWCSVTLVAIQYMFALLLVMQAAIFLRYGREQLTQDEMNDLRSVFGSIPSAMLSLFTISMGGGDWAIHYRILSPTGHFTQVIYLVFVAFSFIAVLNVILGIFVEKAMKNLEPTKEEYAREHAEEEIQTMNELKALCQEGDENGDGELSAQDWHDMFSGGKICSYMDRRGFRSHDLRAFFDVCAARSESGKVNIDAFVRGCMRLRGPSSCFDVQTLLVEVHQVHERILLENSERRRQVSELHEYIINQFARLKPERVAAC